MPNFVTKDMIPLVFASTKRNGHWTSNDATWRGSI